MQHHKSKGKAQNNACKGETHPEQGRSPDRVFFLCLVVISHLFVLIYSQCSQFFRLLIAVYPVGGQIYNFWETGAQQWLFFHQQYCEM